MKFTFCLLLMAFACLLTPEWARSQGSLTPPGAPAPTMKTLDQVEARKLITAAMLPLTISTPGSYYLAENIAFTTINTSAITIASSDVTIDLNGFTLSGQGNTGTTGTGISALGIGAFTGITIRNGIITNFRSFGIDLSAGNSISFIGSNTAVTITDIQAIGNNVGQALTAGMAGVRAGNNGIVRDCIFRSNGNNGLVTGNGMIVTRNVSDNNGRNGMIIFSDCHVYDNICKNNGVTGGILDAGIYVFSDTANSIIARRTLLERNQVLSNADFGIQITGQQNVLFNNVASNNGVNNNSTDNYQIGSNNRFGVLTGISGSGSFTTSEPFANFFF